MKKKLKALLCLLLATVMVLSLAACGSKSTTPSDAVSKTPEETPSDKLVYAADFVEVDTKVDNGLSPLAYTADGFYAQSWEKTGQREIPEDAVIRYDGEYDIFGAALFYVTFEGKATRLEAYSGVEVPENTEGRLDYFGTGSLSKLIVNDDGTLTALESLYISWFDGPESERFSDNQGEYTKSEQHYYIRHLDKDGKELSTAELDYEEKDTYLDLYNAQFDDDGNLVCTSETKLIGFKPDGTQAFLIENSDYLDSLVRLKDGRLAVSVWGGMGEELHIIDVEKGELGEAIMLPRNAYSFLTGGGDYDLYYKDGMNLFGFKLGDEEGTKILNWINVDVNGNMLNGIYMDEESNIYGVLTEFSTEKANTEIVKLSLVPESSLPVKKTLTLAVMYLDYQVQQKIIDFNRHSDTTRIEVKDYSEYNTEEDYTAGLTKLTTEIMAGNLPDLLNMDGLPYDQLANKGLLEDLYPYLDEDKDLNRDDFFPTVLSALEVNGGLYQVAPSFQILTLIGGSSVVGNKPGWTYDEFNAALASMPAGCTPLDQYTTRDDILQRLVTLEMENLVDWSTGKCSFDGEEYVNILEFANRFQAEFDWENYEWTTDESTEKRIAEGRQMLMAANIYSIEDMMYNDLYFGGDATYIGYPTSNGVGNMMSLTSGFSMSAKCSDKEAAWAFLRTVLSEEYQSNIWGLPINKHAFDKKLEEAMTPTYEKDAEGNIKLDENGEKIQVSRGGIGMADGSVHELYAMTQEQADKLIEVINTTTRVVNTNSNLLQIAVEEAQPFFAGQKTAEEVARLTQSKVNLYVNEQR